jgi:ribosomal 50S subunit-recycling heat shock protein
MMRLDLLLNKLCLTKTRSVAKKACDKGLLLVNGKAAKASQEIKADDLIYMKLYGFAWELRITQVPTGNVAKKDAGEYYELLSREALAED